ncbi:hypothetical protein R5R35_013150 [Gryllus longicercus]|uniref:Uncharacterized protein n=1 Tax=Gryllus longicercus TaxID=2509291 RepID=A0AAN9VLV0_9ORTH
MPPSARPAGEARVGARRGGELLRALGEGSVALLAASALLALGLCAWLVAAELRLRRRRDRWRPRPPPRPRSGGRPSRVLLLAAEGCGADEGYVQPAPAPAPAVPRAHSYLLVVGGDPAGAATPAYEEVLLRAQAQARAQAPGADEGYLPMQRHRLPSVLRVVRGAALEPGAVGVARDDYLFMAPLAPPMAEAVEVAPGARPLPPLPAPAAARPTRGPRS